MLHIFFSQIGGRERDISFRFYQHKDYQAFSSDQVDNCNFSKNHQRWFYNLLLS